MDLTAAFAALAEPIAAAVARRLEPVIRSAVAEHVCDCRGHRRAKPPQQREGAPPRTAYTLPEVAASIGISTRQVHRLIERGDLPSNLIGGRRVVPVKALDELLDTAPRVGSAT